jgi:hypothetical protein
MSQVAVVRTIREGISDCKMGLFLHIGVGLVCSLPALETWFPRYSRQLNVRVPYVQFLITFK